MNQQLRSIITFLLDMNDEECTDKKHLAIQINEEDIFDGGNVKIDATGNWIKNFCIQKFKSQAWRNYNKNIFVHFGETSTESYHLYKITDVIILELEPKPFVNNCEYYLSFTFNIPKKALRSKFPIINKYCDVLTKKHTDIKLKFVASENFWKEDDEINKCINLIGECISDVMIYDPTNNFRDFVFKSLGVSDKENAISEINKKTSNLLLQYDENQFND